MATRIALIICAAVHLYGASFYFSNAESYEAYRAFTSQIAPSVKLDSTQITLELATLALGVVLLVWFFSVAYANTRALGEEPRLSELVGWSGLPWLFVLWPQMFGRDLVQDPSSWGDLRLGNALDCGGEAATAVAALAAIVAVTRISLSQSPATQLAQGG